MVTKHRIFSSNSSSLKAVKSNSIHLVVTSPPYPMIEMWDNCFSSQSNEVSLALKNNKGYSAFKFMHESLNKIWAEADRVLINGGIVCINIADATRSVNNQFKLFPNRAEIINHCLTLGWNLLPSIIWKKPSNAPNKFMGSGMLPTSAYISQEHEHILIFRKGSLRKFSTKEEKSRRSQSAYFWEERNEWFSDQWNIKGARQQLFAKHSRERSAAYPIELPYRLINMFSIIGDNILDPFLGTGTTSKAALVAGRNSVGYEIDSNLTKSIFVKNSLLNLADSILHKRFERHLNYIENRLSINGPESIKHFHEKYGFPVITCQETEIKFPLLTNVKKSKHTAIATYS